MTTTVERYCVDSGRPVRLIPGDRCRAHGNRSEACTTATRAPRCTHPYPSPNHPTPTCSECGQLITKTPGRPTFAEALAMVRDDPAIMRQIIELSATSAVSVEDAARAVAQFMITTTEANE